MRTLIRVPRCPALRVWTRWTAGFLAFPIAGLAGRAAAGPVDDAMSALVGGGWTVTTLAGVGVDARFTVFGATGAPAFCALSGILLHGLLPATAPGRTTGSGSLHEVDA
ncbi:hypothetical protein [Streptomyces vietnamensis]|uniref:Uncharacterized protein n=1 Tax=Streptomyces vietnamensis TaxID=362257 RepID=A0A0B5II42_9ACTN|nr:hypothetical protein [Streptomyces vietnamensis]AJF69338.1 hypothetical protein SVTN_38835 [Streptomyces vietnamensis]